MKFDAVNNILISVPGSSGCKKLPTIVLQGHMDMVCEKLRNSEHDFSKDPITHIIDGDWLKADGTSLGADNGIGVAADFDPEHLPTIGLQSALSLIQLQLNGKINHKSENGLTWHISFKDNQYGKRV